MHNNNNSMCNSIFILLVSQYGFCKLAVHQNDNEWMKNFFSTRYFLMGIKIAENTLWSIYYNCYKKLRAGKGHKTHNKSETYSCILTCLHNTILYCFVDVYVAWCGPGLCCRSRPGPAGATPAIVHGPGWHVGDGVWQDRQRPLCSGQQVLF